MQNTSNHNNKRIAINTALMYSRMLIIMLINLFLVRLVLKTLGETDYGIYNVVAGVITMMNCVVNVLTSATQRFYSFSLGESNQEKLKRVFSASINIYLCMSLAIVLIAETLGLWFLNDKLVIPDDRIIAANYLYQFTVFTFITTMMQAPYSSAVIANEDMGIYAIMTILDSILRLLFVLLISYLSIDRLVAYGGALLIIPLFLLFIYIIIGRRYAECRYVKVNNKGIYREVLSFSGWSLFGSMASVGMNQGNTILVNLFFGPVTNAARAIAQQINGAITSFCSNFIMAIRPPMIKSYAEGNYTYLNTMFNFSNKVIYYCMLIVSIPLFLNMANILHWWLGIENPETSLFSQMTLIYALIMSLNNPISIVVQATGHVKKYNVYVESFTLLCPIITFVLYELGFPAYVTYLAMIVTAVFAHIIRLRILKENFTLFSYKEYTLGFVLPALLISVLTFVSVFIVQGIFSDSMAKMCASIVVSIVSTLVLVLILGLSTKERNLIISLIKK